MFGFIKKVFIAAVSFLIPNVLSVNSLECVSMNNQECNARPKIIDINNKLVEECTSVIEENKIYNETLGVTS